MKVFKETDVLGEALYNFYHGRSAQPLWLHSSWGDREEMPMEVFFRKEDELPEAEVYALELCKGKVLDIGAGTGPHALVLQSRGLGVTALDQSPACVQLMKELGVKMPICGELLQHQGRYDTLLMLMNGLGIAGTLVGLEHLLNHLVGLLRPGGIVVFDSSDVSYLTNEITPTPGKYIGEVSYQYEYKGRKGPSFDWLYADADIMDEYCKKTGWHFQVAFEDESGAYVGTLRR